jgi:hypothetical protein
VFNVVPACQVTGVPTVSGFVPQPRNYVVICGVYIPSYRRLSEDGDLSLKYVGLFVLWC